MTMLKKVVVAASQAVQAEAAPAPVRRYRALMVRGTLVVFVAAFAVLTLLVKTIPSFAIDLHITKAIQMIHFPAFTWLMNAISWPGFVPQSMIISALIVVLILGFGLHWEAVVALVGAVFPTAVNLLVKDLVGRPRPDSSLVNVYAALTDYSFPSGHVMFYWRVWFCLVPGFYTAETFNKTHVAAGVVWNLDRFGRCVTHLRRRTLGQRRIGGLFAWQPDPSSHYPVLYLGQDALFRSPTCSTDWASAQIEWI